MITVADIGFVRKNCGDGISEVFSYRLFICLVCAFDEFIHRFVAHGVYVSIAVKPAGRLG